jgi:hypothetical protein
LKEGERNLESVLGLNAFPLLPFHLPPPLSSFSLSLYAFLQLLRPPPRHALLLCHFPLPVPLLPSPPSPFARAMGRNRSDPTLPPLRPRSPPNGRERVCPCGLLRGNTREVAERWGEFGEEDNAGVDWFVHVYPVLLLSIIRRGKTDRFNC